MNIAVSREQISDLAMDVEPLAPDALIADVANRFLSKSFHELLCLPIVEDGVVLGTISRYTVMEIFLKPYGRELHGPRKVLDFANVSPLLIDASADVEMASVYVRAHITNPITEDFVITRHKQYAGMGAVLSLLELMEKRAKRRNRTLAIVNKNLKSSQTRLIQSEKMASLGQMVAGIAHEINTPLGYVNSNIELARDFVSRTNEAILTSNFLVNTLLDGTGNDEQLGQCIQQTAQQTEALIGDGTLNDLGNLFEDSLHGLQQISELVVSLRNFSRIDHTKIGRVNIHECIETALTIGRNIIKQKADIKRDFSEDNVDVECVASQINQVLLNIFNNAAQAIPKHGVILIRTRAHPKWVDIHIRDNGCGMTDEIRKRIFDPFFTTKAIGEGTGLGLSISFQIIQQHGGVIDARSAPGKGTEFIVRLPRNHDQQSREQLMHL